MPDYESSDSADGVSKRLHSFYRIRSYSVAARLPSAVLGFWNVNVPTYSTTIQCVDLKRTRLVSQRLSVGDGGGSALAANSLRADEAGVEDAMNVREESYHRLPPNFPRTFFIVTVIWL
jgi:hypothetical protein